MDHIRERIKKLLRLGRSTNANEAGAALKAAWEIARRHHVCVEELDLEIEKDLEPIAEKTFPVGKRLSLEHKLAIVILEDYFHVRCITARPDILIFGEAQDIVFAEFVFDFLVDSVRRGIKSHKQRETKARRVWNNSKRASYARGFFYAIHRQLSDASDQALPEPQNTALARVSRIDSFIDSRYRNQIIQRPLPNARKSTSAIAAGFIQGEKTSINKPLAAEGRLALP